MKEMLRSKGLLLFIALVLGVTYFYAGSEVKLEETEAAVNEQYIASNIQ